MGKSRAVALLAILVLMGFSLVPANADIVDDIVNDATECTPVPINPTLSDFKVTGSGGIADCKFAPLGFTVCLDYMQTIQAHSCVKYLPPETSGETNAVPCIPGIWTTTVIIEGPQSVVDTALTYIDRHSNPSIFVKDCVIAEEPRP